MTDLYWLEQKSADVPAGDDWLSAGEAARVKAMRVAKRRQDWRLGRWTAKRVVSAYLAACGESHELPEIEIIPAPSGAPEVRLHGRRAPLTISLSHRNGAALCVMAITPVQVGCDLELIEPRSDCFIDDYFTDQERALIMGASPAERSRLATLLWSAKESALKAVHEGLRRDTRSVTVNLPAGSQGPDLWRPLRVKDQDRGIFHGWWQECGGLIKTIVASPAPSAPIEVR